MDDCSWFHASGPAYEVMPVRDAESSCIESRLDVVIGVSRV